MLFIGIALVIAFGIAMLIASDAGSLMGLTQTQTAQLIPLVIILIVIAGGAFTQRRRFGDLLGGIAAWVGIFAVVLVGYAYRDDLQGIAGRVMGELSPGVAIVDATRGTASFRRGIGGHFELETLVNGERVPMIFDTGATAVVLTADDAASVGLHPETLRYTVPVQTANGTGLAARVRLKQVDVGGIVRQDVEAFVSEPGALTTSLLGMTFLETLERYTVSRDGLELTD